MTKSAESEVKIGRSIVDILVPPDHVIEIQTSSFFKIRSKIERLLPSYKVKIVYPVAQRKHILVYDKKGKKILANRKSPKKAGLHDAAFELSGLRNLIGNPNLSIDIVFIEEEEIRKNDGKGSWRRRGISITDRRLVSVKETIHFANKADFLRFLPADCPALFSNKDLAKIQHIPVHRAQQVTFLLRKIGLLEVKKKNGRSFIFGIIH
ncbi:MAG: hypothetical protein EHM28_03135 [Spirochaetaceae bacterium]|nr:MAG: hypothetical protein EHM28_03135 [Spirochaetaceae bacterium]